MRSTRIFDRIHQVIRRIPRGKVMTYGDVAIAAGIPRGARVVGYALRGSGNRLPWQRVVGRKSRGRAHITIKDPIAAAMQKKLLMKEGVKFGKDESIDLARYGAAVSSRSA
jgi:methylated-DNA-protein-cysteine methyltransferase-like protein